MEFVTYDQLRVEPYELERVLDFSLEATINHHTKAVVVGRITPENNAEYVQRTHIGTNIKISQIVDDEEKILFQGVVIEIGMIAEGEVNHLIIEAFSHTYLMDIKKIKRSFQNKAQTYDQMLEEICSAYDQAAFINDAAPDKAIGQFILQYDETDMEYLVRTSSWHNTGIVPEHTKEGPKFYFGVPQDLPAAEIQQKEYSVSQEVGRNRKSAANSIPNLTEHLVYYHVVDAQVLKIGQPVDFLGKKLYVHSVTSQLTEGLLKHHYTLTTPDGLWQDTFYNQKYIGLSLMGSVIDVTRDQVKIHLDIDEQQDVATAYWFPYSTMYTGSGTGWYCPPEISDRIRVYSPTSQESGCFAISAVSVDTPEAAAGRGAYPAGGSGSNEESAAADEYGLDRDRLSDTSVKSLMTIYGKEIVFAPKSITIHGGTFHIVLHDDNGIDIFTDNNINMHAKQKVTIASEKIAVIGKQRISLTCEKGSEIKMDANIEMSGVEVKQN